MFNQLKITPPAEREEPFVGSTIRDDVDRGPLLWIGAWNLGSGKARHEVTYLRFDTSSIRETISDASIDLVAETGSAPTSVYFYGLSGADSLVFGQPWDEMTLTYNTASGLFSDRFAPGDETGTLFQRLDLVDEFDGR